MGVCSVERTKKCFNENVSVRIYKIVSYDITKLQSHKMTTNWKNYLQEYCQKQKISLPNYRIKNQFGPAHISQFQVKFRHNRLNDKYNPFFRLKLK